MWERLKHLVIKEFIQILRNPRMRFVLVAPPLIQLVAYGYAFNLDISAIPTAIADFENTQETRELVRRFASSGYFDVRERVGRAARLRRLLDHGDVKVALQFDPGFSRDLRRGQPAELQILIDGTDPNTAMVAAGYASGILARYNAEQAQSAVAVPATRAGVPTAEVLRERPAGIDLRSRAWYNPDLASRNFLIPGVIAFVTMLVSLQLTSMSIVREREVGTMEQLLVTPLRPAELILGKTIIPALVSVFDIALVTGVAVLWFEVPIRGSLLLLFGSSILFLLSAVGGGLYISTLCQTQQQAMMSMAFFFQPAMLLSGFLFPIANMPVVVQYLCLLNPLRHFMVIVRGIFLKGVGMEVLWPEILALLLLGAVLFTLSTRRFRMRLG
jgi:ABC-2 type transport system permease protein